MVFGSPKTSELRYIAAGLSRNYGQFQSKQKKVLVDSQSHFLKVSQDQCKNPLFNGKIEKIYSCFWFDLKTSPFGTSNDPTLTPIRYLLYHFVDTIEKNDQK